MQCAHACAQCRRVRDSSDRWGWVGLVLSQVLPECAQPTTAVRARMRATVQSHSSTSWRQPGPGSPHQPAAAPAGASRGRTESARRASLQRSEAAPQQEALGRSVLLSTQTRKGGCLWMKCAPAPRSRRCRSKARLTHGALSPQSTRVHPPAHPPTCQDDPRLAVPLFQFNEVFLVQLKPAHGFEGACGELRCWEGERGRRPKSTRKRHDGHDGTAAAGGSSERLAPRSICESNKGRISGCAASQGRKGCRRGSVG